MGVAMHIMNGVSSEMCVGNGGHQVQGGGLLSPSCPFHVERHYHETYIYGCSCHHSNLNAFHLKKLFLCCEFDQCKSHIARTLF